MTARKEKQYLVSYHYWSGVKGTTVRPGYRIVDAANKREAVEKVLERFGKTRGMELYDQLGITTIEEI